MKIGILTYHWVANFGANLQTLSTFDYFKSKGIEVRVINWIPADLEQHYKKVASHEQIETHKEFRERYFEMTKLCRTSSDIAEVIMEEGIDIVVIGSDAVLTYVPFIKQIMLSKRGLIRNRPYSDSVLPNPFWGDFLDKVNVKCALMSASAQNTDFHKTLLFFAKTKVDKLLDRIKYISVRDVWTQKMLAFLTKDKVIAPITPDPVFAFNNNTSGVIDPQVEKDIIDKFHLGNNYILFSVDNSILPDQWVLRFEQRADLKGYKVIELPRSMGEQHTILNNKIALPLNPLEWYYLLKNSSGYVGVLMHPILVALHNIVPVYSFDTYGFVKSNKLEFESSKIYHIMKRFDLLHNYYNVKSGNPLPESIDVLDAIMSFDKEKCSKMSYLMYLEYIEMMNNITRI